jgi:hypothetical protein
MVRPFLHHDANRRRWSQVRFALGMSQMAAAVVSFVLLFRTGVTRASLSAVVVASTLSMISVIVFGRRRGSD